MPLNPPDESQRHEAWLTMLLLTFAFMAFDDITTDNATTFRAERTVLVLFTIWCAVPSWRLVSAGYERFGVLSFVVLGIGALAQLNLGHRIAVWNFSYVAMLLMMAWFLVVAGWLLAHRSPRLTPAR